jgi:hypothetical protein
VLADKTFQVFFNAITKDSELSLQDSFLFLKIIGRWEKDQVNFAFFLISQCLTDNVYLSEKLHQVLITLVKSIVSGVVFSVTSLSLESCALKDFLKKLH